MKKAGQIIYLFFAIVLVFGLLWLYKSAGEVEAEKKKTPSQELIVSPSYSWFSLPELLPIIEMVKT